MSQVTTTDIALPDVRTLRGYITGPPDASLTDVWHHGSPNLGEPPQPLFTATAERGTRWRSYDRPA